jgi:hypothetical protein
MLFFLPRTLDDYRSFVALESYEAVKVPGTEVAWADYEALARDFPFLHGLSEAEVDQWIVDHFSDIGREQIALGTLRNSPIPAGAETITVYRQANFSPEYLEFQGRGDIVVVHDPRSGKPVGLVDRKGVGVSKRKFIENQLILTQLKDAGAAAKAIETRSLSNGLMYFGEALTEAALLKVAQRSFDILNYRKEFDRPFPNIPLFENAPLQTIEGYFVLKLPFLLHAGEHGSFPAGIYARQAHVGRVWAGKIFHRLVNIKQCDFFLGLCDGGTVRIRLPELIEIAKKIEGGPRYRHHEMGVDIVARFEKGEKKALENTIQEVLAPVASELAHVDAAFPMPRALGSSEEAFSCLLDALLADHIRFMRFSEVVWYAQVHNPDLTKRHRDRIERLARVYLALPHSIKDHDESGKPARRWGFLLHFALPSAERKSVLARSFWDLATEPEFLARAVLLLPPEETKPYRRKIHARAGGWLKIHLEGFLGEPHLAQDPRRKDWLELHEWLKNEREEPPKPIPFELQKWVTRANLWAWLRFR